MSKLMKIYAWLDSRHRFLYLVIIAFLVLLGAYMLFSKNGYIEALGIVYCLALMIFGWEHAIFHRAGGAGE